ncbi:MAG TPA: methyltransferase [Candidatus Cybelea sp.]|nr:methyltransferase [Candidatus Cybelea sp.]
MPCAETGYAPEPQQKLLEMLAAKWIAQAISVAATLGIADLLADSPKSAEQLAAASSSQADSLYRMLRALTIAGVFAETDDHRFSLTPLSECLRSDARNSMRNWARMQGLPLFVRSWDELLGCVKTGQTGLKRAFGLDNPFAYFAEHGEDGQVFNDAMTDMTRNVGPLIAEAYDFGKFRKIVDAGGGHGILLASILARYPQPRGVLFDLSQVLSGAARTLEGAGITDRCELVAGDLFESVPGADAYVMKSIIHAFQKERASAILRNVRRAIDNDGRVLIVEHVVPSGSEPAFGKVADLQMLVMSGGRERTSEEFADLFEASGFRLGRIHPTRAPQSIVEGVPS